MDRRDFFKRRAGLVAVGLTPETLQSSGSSFRLIAEVELCSSGRAKRKGCQMTTDQKIIKNKIGLLELAKQLGNVSRACNIRIRLTCNRGLSGLRCLRLMSWGIVAAVVL